MKIEVRDGANDMIGELLMPYKGRSDAPVDLQLGDKARLARIDTHGGFYYVLRSSLLSLKGLSEFTPAKGLYENDVRGSASQP